MIRRYRRIAAGVGITGAVHLVLLALFVFSTTSHLPRAARDTAYRITLVRFPREEMHSQAKIRAPLPPRTVVTARAAPAIHPSVVAQPNSPVATSSPSSKIDAAPSAADVEGMQRTLHALAACHQFGVRPTDKERTACEERLRRIADAAPHIDAPPPPQMGPPPQKANTCRVNARTLLSPRMKCKFW